MVTFALAVNRVSLDHEYAARVRMAGVTTLLVNYLAGDDLEDDSAFGGAWVISGAGEVLAHYSLGQAGLLLVTV